MRNFCIGDIHGNLKGLIQVLERAQVKKDDTIIFLGDYVDGLTDSFGVIELLLKLRMKYNCIFLKGNHDDSFSNWLNTGVHEYKTDERTKTSIESYVKEIGNFCFDKHLTFFKYLSDYYIDDQNRLFIHGGFTSNKGVKFEENVENFYWDRSLWEKAMMQNNNKDYKSYLYYEVFIGHTPTLNWKNKKHYPESDGTNHAIVVPMKRCNIWNVDTGAGWSGGKLTILDVDTKEYWQSDLTEELYK